MGSNNLVPHKNELGIEIWEFAWAFVKHWCWWISTVLGSAFLSIIQGRGIVIPDWILWLLAWSGFVVASFLTWRDQKRLIPPQKPSGAFGKASEMGGASNFSPPSKFDSDDLSNPNFFG